MSARIYGFFYGGFLSAILIRSMGITGSVRDLGVEPRYLVGATTGEFFRDLQQLRVFISIILQSGSSSLVVNIREVH